MHNNDFKPRTKLHHNSSHLWPLRQKRSERLAVFTRIAVHQPFIAVRTDWHAVRTPRANRSKKFIIRSNGSSYAFDKTHQPFERLELSVRENSSAVWTARAIRLRKFISRSNGSSYPFEKIHQPFERLELSVRENSSAVRTARAIQERTVSYFSSHSKKTRRDDFKTINSPFFVKWRMPSCLHYTNSRHASVLCLRPLKRYSLHFLRKTFDLQAPIKLKTLRSLRVRGGLRSHALLPCERDKFQDKHCSQWLCKFVSLE